jgi:SAM-dependent methyltransferase
VVLQKPKFFSLLKYRFLFVNQERWFRWVVNKRDREPVSGFFNEFPRFLVTSRTAADSYRLNQRHRALIQSNLEIIRGQRILDIASHDGRWSFAAYKAGAEHVLGIEARRHLVELANQNIRDYGVPSSKVRFMQGDILDELDRLEPGRLDTVFCFGYLYHTIDHMLLLRKLARLQPRNLVIDTAVSTYPGSIIEVHDEALEHESAGAVGDPGDPTRVVVGVPSLPALEFMLKAAGFSNCRYYNWRKAEIIRWGDLKEYYLGKRISVAVAAMNKQPAMRNALTA